MKIQEIDVTSGEEIVRDMNAEELAQYESDQAEAEEIAKKQAEAKTAKTVAEAKLEALGLTANDLKALGL
jgi:hypothetical protein